MSEAPRPNFYARSEARNQEVRDSLVPLAPGERPPALLATIGFFLTLVVLNVIGLALADDPDPNQVRFFIVLGVVLLALSAGLWLRITLAVLATMVVLAICVVYGALSALTFTNALGLLVSVVWLGICGTLFVKLVRVLSRLQMPRAVPSDGHG